MHYLFKNAFFTKLHYVNLEKFDKNKNYIYICNHQSFFDTVILGLIFPNNGYTMAKDSLKLVPYFGLLYWLSGNFYIKRGHSEKAKITMSKIIKRITKIKCSIIMFPQGTRSKDNSVTKIKRGFVQLAQATQTDILPCIISTYGTSDILCQLRNQKPICIKICEPISFAKSEEEILHEVKDLMNNTIHELDQLSNSFIPLPTESHSLVR